MDKKVYTSLEYLHNIDWRDVFSVWRSYEAYQPDWEKHWQERGFDSWDAWRENYVAPIRPHELKWKIYRIKDQVVVRDFYGVPSKGWVEKCYNGEPTKRLGDILEHPVIYNNDKISSIIKNFPNQTMLTGIVNDGRVILIEGMHRALSLAIASKNGEDIATDLVIALAEHEGDIPSIGKGNLKNK